MNLSLKFDCKLKNNSHVLFEIKNITNEETILQRIKKSRSAKIKEINIPTYFLLELLSKSFKNKEYLTIPVNIIDIP